MQAEVVKIKEGKLVNGAMKYRVTLDVTADEGDQEEFGELDVFQALIAIPYPADDTGSAEAVLNEGVGSSRGALSNVRDTRVADMVGNLQPGDVALPATHPNKSSMLVIKGEKRQVVLSVKGPDDKRALLVIDGKNEKIQFLGFGGLLLQGTRKDGWVLSAGGSAKIVIGKNSIALDGQIVVNNGKLPVNVGVTGVVGGASGVSTPAPGFFA